MKSCDIILPVWNELDVTKRCIDSIIKHTDSPYRLIAIDNASDKDTEEYLKSLSNIKGLDLVLIRNEKNLGFVKAINQGIEKSRAPYICTANNDIVVTAGWLSEMIGIMDANLKIGLINPASNTSGQNPDDGESIDDYALRLKQFNGKFQELYTCRGYCMVIRREVIDTLGPLDDIYHFGYFDDTDYCKRAQKAGFKTVLAKGAYIYHKGSVSFKKLADSGDLFEKNEKIFFERWGRQVRVGYFLNRVDSRERVDAITSFVARSGHQISVFLKRKAVWPVTLDHYDIRRVDLNPCFFEFICLYKILKRRKKKKVDIVLTDDAAFGRMLKMTESIHGSDVLIEADESTLAKALTDKSRDF